MRALLCHLFMVINNLDEDQRLSIDEYNTMEDEFTDRSDYALKVDYANITGYNPTNGDFVLAFIGDDLVATGMVTRCR